MLPRILALLCLAFAACTHAYVPNEYPLSSDRVPPVRSAAPVAVVNVQQRGGPELLFAVGAHKWNGDHREITQHFAEQLVKTLQQSGIQVANGPAPKRLDVSVVSLSAWAAFYHYKAKALISLTTGDGQHFDIVAGNGSPGNIYRALNGVLAVAVLETLKHPGVQAYLASPVVEARGSAREQNGAATPPAAPTAPAP